MIRTNDLSQRNQVPVNAQSLGAEPGGRLDPCPHCQDPTALWHSGVPGTTLMYASDADTVTACPLCERFDSRAQAQERFDAEMAMARAAKLGRPGTSGPPSTTSGGPLVIVGQGDGRRELPATQEAARDFWITLLAALIASALVAAVLALSA